MADAHSTHKLLKHLDRVSQWKEKGYAWPIFVDFDLSNKCNNKCPLCIAKDRDETIVAFEDAKRIISELKEAGVRAMIYGGGGEPSCNPHFEEILEFTKEKVMEIGMFTNGYELSDSLIETIARTGTWMRISLDADSPEMYRKTHGMNPEDFKQVIGNIEKIVDAKKRNQSEIVIGNCCLIGKHTLSGIYNATELSKNIGVDYIRFRPYFTWDGSKKMSEEEKRKMDLELKKSKGLETKDFGVSFAEERCDSVSEIRKRKYSQCYVHNFMTSITPDLNMYTCCVFKNTKRESKYCLGNLGESSFKEIWLSEKRRNIHKSINLSDCPNPCQFESSNELLWDVVQPVMHQNFL